MFRIAVIGPQFSDRLGIVQQCMQCRAAAGPDAPQCAGFGPGCLVTPCPGARESTAQRSRDASCN